MVRNFLKIYYFHTKILCLKLGSCIIQQEMDIVDSNVCQDKCLTRNKDKVKYKKKNVNLDIMKYTPPPFICPFVDTADMEMVVMVVTTLHMVITSRPCTGRTQMFRELHN